MGASDGTRGESGRLASSIIAALALHATALLGYRALRHELAVDRVRDTSTRLWLEFDSIPERGAASASPSQAPPRAALASSSARYDGRGSRSDTGAAGSAEPSTLTMPGPVDSSSPVQSNAPRHLTLEELGVGFGGNNPFLRSATPPSPEELAEIQRKNQERMQQAAMDRDKIRRARGVEVPVIGPLLSLIRTSAAAPESSAIILVRADSSGRIVFAKVLNATGDPREWRRIAKDLVPALAKVRLALRVRSGVDLRIRATTFLRLPSGARTGSSGWDADHGKLSLGFDVSDIGAHPVRAAEATLEGITATDPDRALE